MSVGKGVLICEVSLSLGWTSSQLTRLFQPVLDPIHPFHPLCFRRIFVSFVRFRVSKSHAPAPRCTGYSSGITCSGEQCSFLLHRTAPEPLLWEKSIDIRLAKNGAGADEQVAVFVCVDGVWGLWGWRALEFQCILFLCGVRVK
jgi:hypothetical protein